MGPAQSPRNIARGRRRRLRCAAATAERLDSQRRIAHACERRPALARFATDSAKMQSAATRCIRRGRTARKRARASRVYPDLARGRASDDRTRLAERTTARDGKGGVRRSGCEQAHGVCDSLDPQMRPEGGGGRSFRRSSRSGSRAVSSETPADAELGGSCLPPSNDAARRSGCERSSTVQLSGVRVARCVIRKTPCARRRR